MPVAASAKAIHLRNPAEAAPRNQARLFFAHSAADVLLGLHLQMKAHLRFHLPLKLLVAKVIA
jgi:hypothetical protein